MKIALSLALAASLTLNIWLVVVQPIMSAVNAQARTIGGFQEELEKVRESVATVQAGQFTPTPSNP